MDRYRVLRVPTGSVDELVGLIRELIVTDGMRTGSPRLMPLINTIEYIAELNVRSVLVQENVQDPDFLSEHEAFYSKWSYKVPRYCTRLHFFNTLPISENPLEVVDQMAGVEGSYLGFITLRPIRISPLAATILSIPNNGNNHFILSKDEFRVNIAGQRFYVTGTPFMQQDNAVGACAQASIWMALRTLRRREGHSAYSPAQITTAATKFLVRGRTLPNRDGLIIEQITEALRASGYSPHMIPLRDIRSVANEDDTAKTREALYPYIESGIPVLLILFPQNGEGHAVLLIGHGWDEKPSKLRLNVELKIGSSSGPINVYDASSWVSPLYIHNDNTGPYIPISDLSSTGSYALADAVSAIPFLQPNVFVDAAEAKLTCHKVLQNCLEDLEVLLGGAENAEITWNMPELVTRVYLQDKSDFRSSIMDTDMPDDVKAYYRLKWLPKRIWVMEINLCDGYEANEDRSTRVGEILLDPASEPEDGCFLTIHLGADLLPNSSGANGVVINRNAFDGEIDAFPVSGKRYSRLVRNS